MENNNNEEITRRLDMHKNICSKMFNTYKSKNHDYGNSVKDTYEKFGIDSFLVRMYDKINRLYTLTRKDIKAEVSDEKIEDTLLDLANYAILTLIEINEHKTDK